ncbi:MAG: hypothetical protein M3R53_03260 [Candidatus Eremiobacteraeota bacterium]|nr:hypothetical protein [Candidatus Eremiobacteraeota bacterium]
MEHRKPTGPDDVAREDESPDETTSRDDASLSDYDKTIADSFPSSDPPAMP